MNKQRIKDWLYKQIYYEDDYLKNELIEVANKFKHLYNKYAVDELATKCGLKFSGCLFITAN